MIKLMDCDLPFSKINKVKNTESRIPDTVLNFVLFNNCISTSKWENIKKILAWKIGEDNKLYVKLTKDNKIINAKNKSKSIKINFTERFIDTNNVNNILFINNTQSIKGIYYYIKNISNSNIVNENYSKLNQIITDISIIEKVNFISDKQIVEKYGYQKNYKYLIPPGKPTKLAPIPKPAPERAEAPMLGR